MLFATPGELLFGSILIYYFRILERQMGISRFAAYVAVSITISTLLQIAALVAFPATIKAFSSGPYGYIFSSLTLVYLRIPRLHNLSVFGIPVTDKFFAYLLAAQMAFSSTPASLFSAAIGIITGCIYHFDVVGLQRIAFPQWLQTLVASVLIPKHQSSSISQAPLQSVEDGTATPNNVPRAETLLGPQARGFGAPAGSFGNLGGFAPAQQQMAAVADPTLVESLMGITGMPQHQVQQALVATNNNPDAATAQLLRLD